VGGKGAGQRFCQSNGIYFAILEGSGMAVAAEFLILDMVGSRVGAVAH
jgi:hypothetical protein